MLCMYFNVYIAWLKCMKHWAFTSASHRLSLEVHTSSSKTADRTRKRKEVTVSTRYIVSSRSDWATWDLITTTIIQTKINMWQIAMELSLLEASAILKLEQLWMLIGRAHEIGLIPIHSWREMCNGTQLGAHTSHITVFFFKTIKAIIVTWRKDY